MRLGKWNWCSITLCCSLLLAASGALARSFPGTSDPTLAAQERWGAYSLGYVVSGCTHGPGAGTTASVTACRAFALVTPDPARLVGFEETTARTISYSGGDGIYWLAGRSDPGVTPAGWTCLAGTHYCTVKSATRPAAVSGLVLLQSSTLAAGAISDTATMTPPPGGVYSPERYGAKGDGVTDDTAAFELLSAALPGTGAIVQLATGATYYLNTAGGITFPGAVILQGAGPQSSSIRCGTTVGADVGCVTLQGAGSIVQDIGFDEDREEFTGESPGDDLSATLLVTDSADQARITRIAMRDTRYGVRIVGATGVHITHSTFLNTVHRSDNPPEPTSAGFNGHIVLDAAIDTVASFNTHVGGGNHIISQGKTGVAGVSTRTTYSNNHGSFPWDACAYFAATVQGIIQGNTCLDANFFSFKMRGDDNVMTSNIARNPTIACSGMAYLQGSAATHSDAYWAHRNRIVGNTFEAASCGLGIDIGPVTTDAPARDTVISGNIIQVSGPGTANAIGGGFEWGISLRGGHRNTLVAHNTITGPNVGIYTDDLTFSDQTGTLITGNTIIAAPEIGIRVRRQEKCDVLGNRLLDLGAAATGIVVDDSDDCTIADNNLQTVTSTALAVQELNGSLRTQYRYNRWEGHSSAAPFVFGSGLVGNTARLSADAVVTQGLTGNTTLQPGLYKTYIFTATGNYSIGVDGQWPMQVIHICNTDPAATLTFTPTATALVPQTCDAFMWLGSAWRNVVD